MASNQVMKIFKHKNKEKIDDSYQSNTCLWTFLAKLPVYILFKLNIITIRSQD